MQQHVCYVLIKSNNIAKSVNDEQIMTNGFTILLTTY